MGPFEMDMLQKVQEDGPTRAVAIACGVYGSYFIFYSGCPRTAAVLALITHAGTRRAMPRTQARAAASWRSPLTATSSTLALICTRWSVLLALKAPISS